MDNHEILEQALNKAVRQHKILGVVERDHYFKVKPLGLKWYDQAFRIEEKAQDGIAICEFNDGAKSILLTEDFAKGFFGKEWKEQLQIMVMERKLLQYIEKFL